MSEKRKKKLPHYGNKQISPGELARYIDQTLLTPYADEADIIRLCKGAIKYNFYSVCVNPYYIPLSKAILAGYDTKVTTVVGFPLGMTMKSIKVYEAMQAVLYGAQELDIVINTGAVKSGNLDYAGQELSEILSANRSVVHTVIIETCCLTEKEKSAVAEIAAGSGVRFINLSAGPGSGGKNSMEDDIKMIKSIVRERAEVKVSGDIRTLSKMLRLIKAGAARIGTSAGTEIMQEALAS